MAWHDIESCGAFGALVVRLKLTRDCDSFWVQTNRDQAARPVERHECQRDCDHDHDIFIVASSSSSTCCCCCFDVLNLSAARIVFITVRNEL